MDDRYLLTRKTELSLPAEDADKLIKSADGKAALLYIYLLRSGSAHSLKEAARALKLSLGEAENAFALLRSIGVLEKCREAKQLPPAEELPEYSAEEIYTRSASDGAFTSIVDETAKAMGRKLSAQEMKMLFGVYDYLGLPPDVIMMLVHHCIERYREKAGPGRTPTMRSIEKEAFVWANREIMTFEQAEAYIRSLSERREAVMEVKSSLRIKGRDLSPTEQKYIESWLDMGFEADALAVAYDRTVVQKGSLIWSYMNAIVRKWQEKGLRTREEIEKKDGRAAQGVCSGVAGARRFSDLDLLESRLKERG